MPLNYMFPTVTVKSRFFFFTSLGKPNPPTKPEILPGERETLNSAEAYLNNLKFTKSDASHDPNEIIKMSTDFLRNAWMRELKAEKVFYQKNIVENKDLPEKYRNQIEKCIHEKNFDYYNFINILKTHSETTKLWKKNLTDLQDQLGVFNKEIKEKKHQEQLDPHDSYEDTIRPLIAKLFKDDEFYNRQSKTAVFKAEGRRGVIERALKGMTTNRSKDIVQLVQSRDDILDILTSNGIKINNIGMENIYVAEIIQGILEDVYQKRKNKNASTVLTPKEVEAALQKIKNAKEGKKDKDDKEFQERLLRMMDTFRKASEIFEQESSIIFAEKQYLKIGNKKGITGLTKDVRLRLAKILEKKDENGYFHQMAKNNLKTQKEKEEYLQKLRKALVDLNKDSSDNDKKAKEMTNDMIVNTVNKMLSASTTLTLSARSEYRSAQNIKKAFGEGVGRIVGQKNRKADTIYIPLGQIYGNFEIPEADREKISQLVIETYENNYETIYKEQLENIRKEADYYVPTMKKEDRNNRRQLFKNNAAYSTAADQVASDAALQKALEALNKALKTYDKYDPSSPLQLKDLFILENSVKRSEFYLNDYGFEGGSIGASLGEQLTNIQNMAEAGGITPPDIDWLTFAVLNSGNGMIGSRLRSPLEVYFTSFASNLMFQTGTDIWKQTEAYLNQNNLIENIRGNNTMRLYTFDNLFVPASFILKITLDALTDAATVLQSAKMNKAIIVNNVTEADKVNTAKSKNIPYSQPAQAWYETAATNFSKVTIEMQLLAGFLDVLDALEEKLNKKR